MKLEPYEYQKNTNLEEHNDMIDKINELVDAVNEGGSGGYILPPATSDTLGGVIVGDGLSVDSAGKISVEGGGSGYVLPTATADRLGGIKVGNNLTVESDGTLNATGGSSYELPTATADRLGGIKVGDNLTIESDGTLNATGGSSYELPTATADRLGGIKVGDNLTIESDGTLNATGGSSYELPIASETVLGGIKVGDNLTIESDGTLNATGGSGNAFKNPLIELPDIEVQVAYTPSNKTNLSVKCLTSLTRGSALWVPSAIGSPHLIPAQGTAQTQYSSIADDYVLEALNSGLSTALENVKSILKSMVYPDSNWSSGSFSVDVAFTITTFPSYNVKITTANEGVFTTIAIQSNGTVTGTTPTFTDSNEVISNTSSISTLGKLYIQCYIMSVTDTRI